MVNIQKFMYKQCHKQIKGNQTIIKKQTLKKVLKKCIGGINKKEF